MANKRDLTIGIDGDPKGFDEACKSAEESAAAFDRELGKLERELEMAAQRSKAAADAVKKYGREQDRAALEAKKLGDEAERAGQRAARAQAEAADAAQKLADGEGDAARAAELAARAEDAVERAAIKAAEAHRAAAKAADQQAAQERQLARDAQLAAAAERLGALKARGAVNEHNAALRALEASFGDLSKEGNGAFKTMETSGTKAFSAIGSTGYGAIAQVAAIIAAIPFAALGAEAAVAGGIGGALAGIGLMATKSDATVQAALHGMTSHIRTETTQMAAPFKQTWLAIAAEGTKTFDALAPELSADFAKLAPVITNFVHDAGYAITLLGPSFGHATDAADKLIAALGGKLPEISRSVGKAIDIVSKSAGDNADEFANIAAAVAGLLPPLAHLLDWAVKIGPYLSPVFGLMAKGGASVNALHDGMAKLSFGLIDTDHSLQTASGSFPSFTQQAAQARIETQHIATSMDIATLSAQQMGNEFDKLAGKAISDREGLIGYRQAVVAMTESLKANGKAHGFNTAKGAENEAGLNKIAVAAQKAAQGMKDDGKSAQSVSKFLEGARRTLIAAAEKMGYTSSQARDLANKLLGVTRAANTIPSGKRITLSSNAASETRRINAMRSALDRLHNKSITITTYYQQVEAAHHAAQAERARARGGIVTLAGGGMARRRFPDGGMVRGPGTTTSDSIPAALSDREFVVNADATAANLPLLEAINAGRRVAASMVAPRAVSAGGGPGALSSARVAGGRSVVELVSDGSALGRLLLEVTREQIRVRGGDVQVVLGQ